MPLAPRLQGTIHLPADKSIAHRALLLNALGHGTATVTVHRPGADVRSTAAALSTLGLVSALSDDDDPPSRFHVTGAGTPERAGLPAGPDVTLDCGNSGTLMRLLAGAATTRPGRTTLTGDASLTSRPMDRVATPLRSIGASVTTTEGRPPVVIEGGHELESGAHTLQVASAQVLGAIILASLPTPGTTEIRVPGPTRDHTERMLAWLGVDIERDGLTTRMRGPSGWEARDVVVPADPSAAAFWMVAGAVHPDARITLPHVGLNPTRLGVIRVLERMGAQVSLHPSEIDGPEPSGDITVTSAGQLRAVELGPEDVADVIDELPVLAVAMAAAHGTSTVSGAGELRVKESDRIRLVVEGLAAIGVEVEETEDGWRITGAPVRTADGADETRPTSSADRASATGAAPSAHRASATGATPSADRASATGAAPSTGWTADTPAATIRTDGDHRIAMAFAVADLVGAGTRGAEVDDPECAAVSYPTFWDDLEELR